MYLRGSPLIQFCEHIVRAFRCPESMRLWCRRYFCEFLESSWRLPVLFDCHFVAEITAIHLDSNFSIVFNLVQVLLLLHHSGRSGVIACFLIGEKFATTQYYPISQITGERYLLANTMNTSSETVVLIKNKLMIVIVNWLRTSKFFMKIPYSYLYIYIC